MFKWDNKYSVGNIAMDDQHKIIIALINKVASEKKQMDETGQLNIELLKDVIGKLTEYTKVHFGEEERILERHNFKGLKQHKMLHQKLIDQLETLAGQIDESPDKSVALLVEFLMRWLQSHILKVDMEYKNIIGERERAPAAPPKTA